MSDIVSPLKHAKNSRAVTVAIPYRTIQLHNIFDSIDSVLGLEVAILLYYATKYGQTIWHSASDQFSVKTCKSYIGIVHHINSGSKSTTWFKLNSDPYDHSLLWGRWVRQEFCCTSPKDLGSIVPFQEIYGGLWLQLVVLVWELPLLSLVVALFQW